MIRNLLKALYYRALVVFDFLATFRLLRSPRTGVCIVRVDAIGDFILWIACAGAFRKLYPTEKIVLICNECCADLAKSLSYWDFVISIRPEELTRDLKQRFVVFRALSLSRFRIAIQPTFSRTFTSDSLIRATRASVRIGFTGDYANITAWQKRITDSWYTQLVIASNRSLMELDRNREFFQGLGYEIAPSRGATLPGALVNIGHLNLPRDYFVIFPGASTHKRMWLVQNFAGVARKLYESTGWTTVLCGSSSEVEQTGMVADCSKVPVIDLAGRTTLTELVEVIRGAHLLVCNETSAVHIAAAVQTRSVCVLGGGHFGRFVPYSDSFSGVKPSAVYEQMECFGCNWKCVKPHDESQCYPCVAAINTDKVINAALGAIR